MKIINSIYRKYDGMGDVSRFIMFLILMTPLYVISYLPYFLQVFYGIYLFILIVTRIIYMESNK